MNRPANAATRRLAALAGLLTLSAAAVNPGPPAPEAQARATALNLPFAFEANRGQAADRFQFIAHGRGCAFLLAPDEAVLAMPKPRAGASRTGLGRRSDRESAAETSVRLVRMRLAGADARAEGVGSDPLPGRVNYLLGNDPAAWRTDVPTFAKVRFREVYPGVSLVYYARDRQLEFDFVVAPDADPSRIAFEISGADTVTVDAGGDLVLQVGGEQLRQHRPIAYQTREGRRVAVASRYHLAGADRVEFRLGAYDRGQTLVIDPVFNYATYFGGAGSDVAWDVAVDASGAAFIAGETTSASLVAGAGAFQTNSAGGDTQGGDAFLAKLSPSGTNLVYLTYLGGSLHDSALALAIDGAGNAYLTGFTDSSNFPTAGPLRTNISGVPDSKLKAHPLEGFVTKLNANGTALVYSAYLGGDGVDEGIGIAVDPAGQAYVAGFTESTNLPVTNALQPSFSGVQDGFVAKLNSAGSAFVYLTYLGGTNVDYCNGLAADAAGYAYVTGLTRSTNFWTANAVQPQINNPSNILATNINTLADAFVTKLTPAGTLSYSTFLGGQRSDTGFRIAADTAGNAFVVGSTESGNFPTTSTNLDGAVWTNRGLADVFVTKVAPDGGTNWLYSVAFGGTRSDEGWDLAVDAAGNVSIIGVTSSTNFPTRAVPAGGSATNNGLSDTFVVGLNADGTALSYSFHYGGPASDSGYGIECDPAGNLYVVGSTSSTNLFVQNALQSVFAGGTDDAFVMKLIVPPVLSILANGGSLQVKWRAPAPEFVLESHASGTVAAWTPVPQPPVTANGYHTVTLDGASHPSASFRLRLP